MSIIAASPAPATTQVRPVGPISSVERACSSLRRTLWGIGYNQTCIGEVLTFARRDGDLEAAIEDGLLDPVDIPAAYEAFERGFDFVSPESHQWHEDGAYWSAVEPVSFDGSAITAADILPAMTPIGVKTAVSTIVDKSATANMSTMVDKPTVGPIGHKLPTEARLEKPPAPADSIAHARQVGAFDLRRRPSVDDWREYQRFQEWRDQSFVIPDVPEQAAAEIGRPFSRC